MKITLLAGNFAGRTAPSRIYSPLVGLDLSSRGAASIRQAVEPRFEYGILPLEGTFTINGQTFDSNELAYLGRGLNQIELSSTQGSRALLLGGEPFAEEIQLWWNFVAHSKQEIGQALEAWNSWDLERFGEVEGFDGERLLAPRLPW